MTIGEWARGARSEALSGPQTRMERRAQGQESQRRGTALEREVRAALEAAGAWVVQVPPAVQLLGEKASTRLLVPGADERLLVARLERPVAPDLMGVSAGGLALAIECKSTQTQEGTWPIGKRLAGHQGAALRACEAAGGAGVLVLRWCGALHLIPWVGCDPAPRLSLRRAEVARWAAPAGVDWTRPLLSREGWAAYCERGWR